MVTPPLAAIEGTTLRLKTATTKRNTRSRRPRTRLRWGWTAAAVVAGWMVVDNGPRESPRFALADRGGGCRHVSRAACAGQAKIPTLHENCSVCYFGRHALTAFLLRFRERRRYVFKRGQMLVDVGLGMLNGNGPLLIPPVGL